MGSETVDSFASVFLVGAALPVCSTTTSSVTCRWENVARGGSCTAGGPQRACTSESRASELSFVRNNTVDFNDFSQWKTAFLAGGGSLAGVDLSFTIVPEPATALLLLAGAMLVGRLRRA